METHQKDLPKKKSVLLFSGGMDSLMYDFLLQPDILLFIVHGNHYEKMEIESIRELTAKGIINPKKVVFDSFSLRDYERDDYIIPNRNLYLITRATHYGETIYVGTVKGDRTLDKSLEFFKKCEDMFDYLFQDQHWCEERRFSIGAPYKIYTKSELVKIYIEKGGKAEHLLVSKSCYEGTNCGCCKPCVRKFIALEYNGISTVGYFISDPRQTDWLLELKDKIVHGQYRGEQEDKEIASVMKWKYES